MNEKIHERLNKREEQIAKWFRHTRKQIDEGKIGGEPGRLWLDKFAKGKGLNIACGDFSIGDSIGVDIDPTVLAADVWTQGDHVMFEPNSLDYIVTNYLEAMPFVLKTLRDWWTLLKPEGTLAIVCRDADKYPELPGPLSNPKRLNCFTLKTLNCYLDKAGFYMWSKMMEQHDQEIWVVATKVIT